MAQSSAKQHPSSTAGLFPVVAGRAVVLLIACSTSSLSAATPTAGWTDVAGVKIPIPPPEHPRLYLRAAEVAQLPARLQDPVLQPVVKRLESLAKKSPQFRVEWEALQYLVKPDRAAGARPSNARWACSARWNCRTSRMPAVSQAV